MNSLIKFHERYKTLKPENITSKEEMEAFILSNPTELNNFFMAALGFATLTLRLGAVILLCKKLEKGDEQEDALFLKQVLDNLRETLPSDSNWKNVWLISAEENTEWSYFSKCSKKGEQSLLEQFVSFRNKFVHQEINVSVACSEKLMNGIKIFDELEKALDLFKDSELIEQEGKFYFIQKTTKLCLHPFVQSGEMDGLPAIFQGLYNNKAEAKYITTLGKEVPIGSAEAAKSAVENLEPFFQPMRDNLRGGAGQVFDHTERLAYYQSCFIGRGAEKNELLSWCKHNTEETILPIYSQAGMGKGALIANLIDELQQEKIPVLYHFCGAGMQNSLHASLYHFILQGKKQQWWNNSDEYINKKLERMPSKYIDLIHFFQYLLSNGFKSPRNNTSNNLILIIDGLDEAAVAYSNYKISDWFYTYNEKEEVESDWKSPVNIRWIFSYRDGFYQFPSSHANKNAKIEILQPMQGLDENSVREFFNNETAFTISEDFMQTLVKRAELV